MNMRRAIGCAVLFAVTSLVAAGCVGGSTDTSEQDKERLKAYTLDQAPADIPVKLGINFDNKVTLVGARIEPAGVVRPGQKVKITMYWKADKDVEDGWNLFTHVIDGSGERILNIDNVGPLREWRETRQVMPPSLWLPGKVYVDEQEFVVPNTVKTDKIQFTTGIWKDNDRLKIVGGPRDRENRGIVATIQTGIAPGAAAAGKGLANTRVPVLRLDRLDKETKITLDGKLDEDAWRTAPSTGPLVDVGNGRPNPTAPVGGSAKMLWNEDGLYFGVEVRDTDVIGGFKKGEKDPHLWTKDTVEIMVDPDGDGDNKDYYEIQIGPQNLVFDSHFDSYHEPKPAPKPATARPDAKPDPKAPPKPATKDGPFGHEGWSSKIKSAVTVNGTLDKPGDKDQGYVVEAMIPWKSFHKAKTTPPKVGDEWRVNVYAIQNNGGAAWSPILGQGTFHKASRFGRLLFGEKGWIAPAPVGGPETMPAAPPPTRPGMPPMLNPRSLPKLKLPTPSGQPIK
jgi:hypothetical protein